MTANPQINDRMTEAEHLAFERASDTRHEYFDGVIFMMAGAARRHVLITGNTFASLHRELRRWNCEVYSNNMRVKLPSPSTFAYPDVAVVCGTGIHLLHICAGRCLRPHRLGSKTTHCGRRGVTNALLPPQ